MFQNPSSRPLLAHRRHAGWICRYGAAKGIRHDRGVGLTHRYILCKKKMLWAEVAITCIESILKASDVP